MTWWHDDMMTWWHVFNLMYTGLNASNPKLCPACDLLTRVKSRDASASKNIFVPIEKSLVITILNAYICIYTHEDILQNILCCCIQRIFHASLWHFFTVCFQMFPHIPYLNICVVTLVAFVQLFSTVRFQMCPQSACIRGCIVTLVAFVWLFSTVCFQMCPQMACLWRCKVT